METGKDHIHILIEYKASDSISNIVKILKQYTTYILWKLYNDVLLKFYWKKLYGQKSILHVVYAKYLNQ